MKSESGFSFAMASKPFRDYSRAEEQFFELAFYFKLSKGYCRFEVVAYN